MGCGDVVRGVGKAACHGLDVSCWVRGVVMMTGDGVGEIGDRRC